jgi:hypothetical protein
VVVADPRAGAEAEDNVAREPARRGEVDVLETGRIAELGMAQTLGEPALLARGPFRLDQ